MKYFQPHCYLHYLELRVFTLETFKDEIISLFYTENKEDKHSLSILQINTLYYLHLLNTKGVVICRIPFKLLTISDKEDLIEDVFNMLSSNLRDYLSEFKEFDYPIYIGLYISKVPEQNVNCKNLLNDNELSILNGEKPIISLGLTVINISLMKDLKHALQNI